MPSPIRPRFAKKNRNVPIQLRGKLNFLYNAKEVKMPNIPAIITPELKKTE